MAMSAGENPDRAQTGSGLTGGWPAHPSEVTAPACGALARIALAPDAGG
ncbi:MAG TPA: hypothetical protein VJ371_08830 [Streptosporangiaceae bacterium]|nr:hypothetical protein [Streptosporangiaceae bacterium]